MILKKNNVDPLFEIDMNEILVQPTHNVMSTGHAMSGKGLLTLFKVNTMIVTR